MTGFETYSPLKWLVDGTLAVHIAQPIAAAKSFVRRGRWLAKGVIAVVGTVSAMSAAAALIDLPLGTIDSARPPLQMVLDLPADSAVTEFVPSLAAAGAADRLIAALRVAPLLPVQSRDSDPAFSF